MPIEFSTTDRSRSRLAVMPFTQRSASVRQPLRRCVTLLNRLCAMIGSKAFSCSWPASAAKLTVTSLPITSNAIWLTTSGMTGFTFPGMMLEPACIGGRLISPRPARGPLAKSRRSLQTFDSLTATRFSTPDNWTNAPQSCVASIRFGAVTSGMPVISDSRRQTSAAYSGCALMPVPIAVAPRLISQISDAASLSRSSSSPSMTAYVVNSWPSVIGTASCNCVRPIFSTSRNSSAFASNARRRTAIASISSKIPK